MKLKVYQGIKELDELAPLWFRLADSLGAASFTQYPETYQSYYKAYNIAKNNYYFIAAVFDDADLVAVFPLRMVLARSKGVKYRVLKSQNLPIPIREVLISPLSNKKDIFECLSNDLKEQIGQNWDYMVLGEVLESSELVKSVESNLFRCSTKYVGDNHLLDVTQVDYLKNVLGKSTRKDLRKKRRKLAAYDDWEFRTIDTYPELQEAFQSFLDTEAAGWKSVRGGKRAVKLHEDKTIFYQSLMQHNAPMGRCHIHLLNLNGRPIAVNFCILTRNTCNSLKIGYDEKFADLSPGGLLEAYKIEYYSDLQSIESIDQISSAPFHLRWRPKCRQVFEVNVYNRTARGAFKYWIRRIKSCMSK